MSDKTLSVRGKRKKKQEKKGKRKSKRKTKKKTKNKKNKSQSAAVDTGSDFTSGIRLEAKNKTKGVSFIKKKKEINFKKKGHLHPKPAIHFNQTTARGVYT